MQNINETSYIILIGIFLLLSIMVLVVMLWRANKRLKKNKKLLKEKDEKIEWIHLTSVANEQNNSIKNAETEKKIVVLQNSISVLETKLKEGTKNQVVAKIELEQAKRDKALERAGLKEQ